MTHADFVDWHKRHSYTYDAGAEALGVSRATYANYVKGVTATTGRAVDYSLMLALACASIDAGLLPLGAIAPGQ